MTSSTAALLHKHRFAIQDVALIDARRGANMFRKIKVPLLGLVENMSGYQCPACGHREHIFGHEGGIRTAADMSMTVLGQVTLFIQSITKWAVKGPTDNQSMDSTKVFGDL